MIEFDESVCQRCGGPNLMCWHAPSPLWNAVMRDRKTGEELFGVVCPSCFAALAMIAGVGPGHAWHLSIDGIDIGGLWEDRDGRAWDATRCRWVEAV